MFQHTKIMKDEEIHITRLEEKKKDKMKWWSTRERGQGKFEEERQDEQRFRVWVLKILETLETNMSA